MHNEKLSRRVLLSQAITAAALIPGLVLTRQALGAAAPPLDPSDPTAKALAYTEASAKPDQNAPTACSFGQSRRFARRMCHFRRKNRGSCRLVLGLG